MGNTTVIRCSRCDFVASTSALWGTYQYQLKPGKLVDIDREPGWCADCQTIVPMAPGRSLIKQRATESASGVVSSYFARLRHRLALRRQLRGPDGQRFENLCLHCGRASVVPIHIPAAHDSPDPIPCEFTHPGCGGDLFAGRSQGFITIAMPIRVFSADGELIEEKFE